MQRLRGILRNCSNVSKIQAENVVLFGIFEVLKEFWQGSEDLKRDRIYSSGNQGVEKGPGPGGTKGWRISHAIPKPNPS